MRAKVAPGRPRPRFPCADPQFASVEQLVPAGKWRALRVAHVHGMPNPTCGIPLAQSGETRMPKMPESSQGPLTDYLRRIDAYPLLSPHEEAVLAKRWKDARDPRAGRLLVVCNLRFVVKI